MENKNQNAGKISLILSIVAIVISAVSFISKKGAKDQEINSTFDERVKSIVIDAVKENPQLLMNAMGEGIAQKREDAMKQISKDVSSKKDNIEKQCLKFGKLESRNIIICFFDPLCKHCMDFQKSMLDMIKEKTDICFKMIPVGVLGEDSEIIAKVYLSIYSKSPEKALAFIEKILNDPETLDRNNIMKIVSSIGLNAKEIEGMTKDSEKKLAENNELFQELRIPVVPAIFINKGSNISMSQETDIESIKRIFNIQQDQPSQKTTEDK